MPRDDVFLDERPKFAAAYVGLVVALAVFVAGVVWYAYRHTVINVDAGHIAILIRKTGNDLPNSDEIAPGPQYKGVQKEYLTEGRYFYNPYSWEWRIVQPTEIEADKLGVRVRLVGEDLPAGQFLATQDSQKGIVPGVLLPGRHLIHPFLEKVIKVERTIVPAGFKGVVTNLSGEIPSKPEHYWADGDASHSQKLLVKPGYRGVQKETLDPSSYQLNPYEKRVDLVDCRNQRFNLGDSKDLGFPSKDGFWVSLDSIVEFRVNPESAARVFVLYNEDSNGGAIDEEVVRKVILPAARSFCRLQGSNNLGREFIQGSTRTVFQEDFQKTMREHCQPLGIDIIQALITKINPPEQIAKPVREREIAKQEEKQFQQQILQQKSEEKLAIEKETVKQKQALVKAEQEVVLLTTSAMREQEVAVTKAKERLAVALLKLDAAKDEAKAVMSRGRGSAEVVQLKNKAEAAGWRQAVQAFSGNGAEYAQYVLFTKLAHSYRKIMVNTADSPIMKVFESFNTSGAAPARPATARQGETPVIPASTPPATTANP